jgi:hypothetical protein
LRRIAAVLLCAPFACSADQHLGSRGDPPDAIVADVGNATDAAVATDMPVATDVRVAMDVTGALDVGTTSDATIAMDATITVDAVESGIAWDANAIDTSRVDVAIDGGRVDVTADRSSLTTVSATCSTNCSCEDADICSLACTGSPCRAACGVAQVCSIQLLARDGVGDCRSSQSCDVSCAGSCRVDCGASRCRIACARGSPCGVGCGASKPVLCPDGVTVVCNGRSC